MYRPCSKATSVSGSDVSKDGAYPGDGHTQSPQNAGAESPADVFFSLWHEYRQLTASTVGVVHLGSAHLPRGKRGVTGSQERLSRPDTIELRTYNGTGLHHFRWHVGQRQEDSWLLMDTTGNHKTSIDYAKNSAYEELGIEPGCWSDMST